MTLLYAVLAGGNGSRMGDGPPKPLREIGRGHTLLSKLITNIQDSSSNARVIVNAGIGDTQEKVREYIQENFGDNVEVVGNKEEPNGTGHGVHTIWQYAQREGYDFNKLGLFYGDVSSDPKSIGRIINQSSGLESVIGAFNTQSPTGKGRLVLDDGGKLITKIVEERDCTDDERKIQLVNSGMGMFSRETLDVYFSHSHTYQGEWPFTNIVNLLQGRRNFGYTILDEHPGNYGANTKEELEKVIGHYSSK
mgnify:CR=1 FL=1